MMFLILSNPIRNDDNELMILNFPLLHKSLFKVGMITKYEMTKS